MATGKDSTRKIEQIASTVKLLFPSDNQDLR